MKDRDPGDAIDDTPSVPEEPGDAAIDEGQRQIREDDLVVRAKGDPDHGRGHEHPLRDPDAPRVSFRDLGVQECQQHPDEQRLGMEME